MFTLGIGPILFLTRLVGLLYEPIWFSFSSIARAFVIESPEEPMPFYYGYALVLYLSV